jgi:hypothetical protein
MPNHNAFRPDSHIATEYRPGLGVKHNDVKPRPREPIAIVIHDTGPGPAIRVNPELDRAGKFDRWREQWPSRRTPFEAASWVYELAMHASGHYLVGQGGECVQIIPEGLVAQHVGGAGSNVYLLPAFGWARAEHRWWRERWPGLSSPRALAGGRLWAGGSCNTGAIGIEVAPDRDRPEGPWSDAAWSTLGRLVGDICMRRGIPCTREYVLTHSDAAPRSRTVRGQASDPAPNQWSWERFAEASGAPF